MTPPYTENTERKIIWSPFLCLRHFFNFGDWGLWWGNYSNGKNFQWIELSIQLCWPGLLGFWYLPSVQPIMWPGRVWFVYLTCSSGALCPWNSREYIGLARKNYPWTYRRYCCSLLINFHCRSNRGLPGWHTQFLRRILWRYHSGWCHGSKSLSHVEKYFTYK